MLMWQNYISIYLQLLENHLSIPIYALTQFMISKLTYHSFYKISYVPQRINNLTEKYGLMNGKQILASLATLYTQINSFRAVVYWNNITNCEYFGLQVSQYDPFFIMPIIFGIINYCLIKTNKNKVFQTINQDQNKFKLINLCFMSSLAVVGIPFDILMIYQIMGICQCLLQFQQQRQIDKILKKSQILI